MYKVYRKIILACLLLIVASTVCGQRVTQTINDGWKFSLFEGDASTADFDVSGWTDVSIPHTWNSKDAEDEIPGYFRGKGWYRKAVTVEELIAGQRVYLCFEGANQETNVFVNGKLVGNHKGGYSAFTFDVTDYVHTGRNLVAVSTTLIIRILLLFRQTLLSSADFIGMFIWCILRPCNCLPPIMLPVEYISKLLE